MARFKAEYATLRPVVIRGNDRTRAGRRSSAGDFRTAAAPARSRVAPDASSSAWGGSTCGRRARFLAGFGRSSGRTIPDIYGFDYNLKCDCEAFVEQTTILPYFKQDVTAQAEMTGAARPGAGAGAPRLLGRVARSSLGMPGTRSQLHVDNLFLPFWLTPRRRVVDDDGDAEFALDWYDDAAVLDAVGGADVYSSVLEPGDSVYIPVAALHGGSNVGDAPALAITGNYHDEAHHAILVDVYCEGKVRRLMRQSTKLTRIKAMVRTRRASSGRARLEPDDGPEPVARRAARGRRLP
ncbi:hypothetical protein JL721_10286 [Aureococcus anophagefferens]|nr:hypothetical protein JL721_10286 [Aureococcus anophagefferens]